MRSFISALRNETDEHFALLLLLLSRLLTSKNPTDRPRAYKQIRDVLQRILRLAVARYETTLAELPGLIGSDESVSKQVAISYRQELESYFHQPVLAVAAAFLNGRVPGHLLFGGRPIQQLTRPQLQQLAATLSEGLLPNINTAGRTSTFAADYYLSLITQTRLMAETRQLAITTAATSGTDLVQVSPNPSTIGDYCDLYRGRVFSISGTTPGYPALADCPNGGPPFHPWCWHYLIPVQEDSSEALNAIGQESVPEQFTNLVRGGGATPAKLQKLWREALADK